MPDEDTWIDVVNPDAPFGLNPPTPGKVEDTRVGKQCVFCGLHPSEKSKEHVLPLWLLEFTGDPKREADFSLWNVKRKFAFDQFTARACTDCNSRWSDLESAVKPVIVALAQGTRVLSPSQAECLLDWFDKVRVGLWIAGLSLGGNPFNVAPMYHVADRIAAKDRLLYVAHSTEPSLRLTFGDISHPAFQLSPNVLRLRINGLAFVSVSAIGIAAGPLGLPRFAPEQRVSKGRLLCSLSNVKTNWMAAPKGFGILAQAHWGKGVLPEVDAQRVQGVLAPDSSKSVVHVYCDGETLPMFEDSVVVPEPTYVRDELHERTAYLEMILRHVIVSREPRFLTSHGRALQTGKKRSTAESAEYAKRQLKRLRARKEDASG